jgi:hypothetical protein
MPFLTKRQRYVRRRTQKKRQIGGNMFGYIISGCIGLAGTLAVRYLIGGRRKTAAPTSMKKNPIDSQKSKSGKATQLLLQKKKLLLQKKKLLLQKKRNNSRLGGVCISKPSDPENYFCRAWTDSEIDLIARSCASAVKELVTELVKGPFDINSAANNASERVFAYMYNHIIENPIQGGTRKFRTVGGEIDTPEKIGAIASKMALVTARGNNSVNIKQNILRLANTYNIDTDSAKVLANVAVE